MPTPFVSQRDRNQEQEYIETVHRRGYRFIAEVNLRERVTAENALDDRDIKVADEIRVLGGSAPTSAREEKQMFGGFFCRMGAAPKSLRTVTLTVLRQTIST